MQKSYKQKTPKSSYQPNVGGVGNWRFLDDFEKKFNRKKLRSQIQSHEPTPDEEASKTAESYYADHLDLPQARVSREKRINLNFNPEQETLL